MLMITFSGNQGILKMSVADLDYREDRSFLWITPYYVGYVRHELNKLKCNTISRRRCQTVVSRNRYFSGEAKN